MTKPGSIQISHQDKVNLFFFDIFLYYHEHFSRNSRTSRTHLACEQGQESQIFAAWSRVTYDSLTCVHACDNFKVEKRTLALQRVRRSRTCPALW